LFPEGFFVGMIVCVHHHAAACNALPSRQRAKNALSSAMFMLEYATTFSAAHAIVIGGVREPLHGHDWHVSVVIEGPSLDGEGLLVDFHWLQEQVGKVIGPWHNRCLNECEPYSKGLNPTAEKVAETIYHSLSERLATWAGNQPKTPVVRVRSVRVTEAIGCAAVFMPRA
jgi:6-pyruvoyltetrahydropterin/6-carboxytetrahydropterin synthase